MNKATQIFILLIAVLFAVGISGCLENDDSDNSGNSVNSSDTTSGQTNELEYNTSIVTVSDLPEGFEFLSTHSVKSHAEGIGITDVLYGYRGYYAFTNDTVSKANVYFYCFKTNTSEDADTYLQNMQTSYANSYGSGGIISNSQFNGHSVIKLTSTDGAVPDMIAWTRDNLLFVVKGQVAGEVSEKTIESLAVASKL